MPKLRNCRMLTGYVYRPGDSSAGCHRSAAGDTGAHLRCIAAVQIVPLPGTFASRLCVAVTKIVPDPLTTASTFRAVRPLNSAVPSPLIETLSRVTEPLAEMTARKGLRPAAMR